MLVETEGLTWEGVECIGVLGDTVVLGFLLSGDGTGRLLEHTGVEGDILVETGAVLMKYPHGAQGWVMGSAAQFLGKGLFFSLLVADLGGSCCASCLPKSKCFSP